MRKYCALLLAAALCVMTFTGCDGHQATNGIEEAELEITGDIYDTGEFRALIPEGWAAFPIPDVFADQADAVKTSCFHIIKGGISEGGIYKNLSGG